MAAACFIGIVLMQLAVVSFQKRGWKAAVSMSFTGAEKSGASNDPGTYHAEAMNAVFVTNLLESDAFRDECRTGCEDAGWTDHQIDQALNRITATPGEGGVEFTVVTGDAQLSEKLLEVLMRAVRKEADDVSIEMLGKRKTFLRRQRKWLNEEIEKTEEALAEVLHTDPDLHNFNSLESEMSALEERIEAFKKELANYTEEKEKNRKVLEEFAAKPEAERMRELLSSSMIGEMVDKQRRSILEKQVEILKEKSIKTDIHPDIVALKHDVQNGIELLKTFLKPEGKLFPYVAEVYQEAKNRYEITFSSYKKQDAELAHLVEATEKSIEEKKEILRALQREKHIYTTHFNRLQALRDRGRVIIREEEAIDALMLNPPELVSFPSRGKDPKMVGIPVGNVFYFGSILALLLVLGGCYLIEYIDPRFFETDQLRMRFKVPILCTLPSLGRRNAQPPLDAAGENCMLLLQKLAQLKKGFQSVVFTSCRPGAGTTTVVERAAYASACLGERVLLVYCGGIPHAVPSCILKENALQDDWFRRRRLACYSDRKRVFPEFLFTAGDDLSLPVVKSDVAGLDVMLLRDHYFEEEGARLKLHALMTVASKRYHRMFFDTPSVARSSSSTVTGALSDGMVIVARAGRTSTTGVSNLLKRWDGAGLTLFGFVVNDVRSEAYQFTGASLHTKVVA